MADEGEDWSTAPGLLGTGSGPTAASDRLALLLLVLECGSQGRVKLCGGRADERHGRSATTLARLMSCTPSRAARILGRLEEQGLVDRRRVKTASGLHHRARLLVPSVAAAHGLRSPPTWGSGPRSRLWWRPGLRLQTPHRRQG
ncbi:hypothetical protein GXW82_43660 [Streptacidiphilus sp. 4-A2]|nr:hypothetical protein [Streptacidiphilus sp. 4-A2]